MPNYILCSSCKAIELQEISILLTQWSINYEVILSSNIKLETVQFWSNRNVTVLGMFTLIYVA